MLQAAQNNVTYKKLTDLKTTVSNKFKAINDNLVKKDYRREISAKIMTLVSCPELPKLVVGLEEKLQDVMRWLQGENSNILGVVGMGGVGELR